MEMIAGPVVLGRHRLGRRGSWDVARFEAVVLEWGMRIERGTKGSERRQHPLGSFIADFYCLDRNLVVEIDGAVHDERSQRERDRNRDDALAERGASVFRTLNDDLLRDPEATLARLRAFLSPSPSPMERGHGGEATPVRRSRS